MSAIAGNVCSFFIAFYTIVNKKGVLRVNNFTYGFYVPGSFQIDGELEASGTTSAIYNLSGGIVNVGEDRSVYVKEVLQTVANNKLSFGACGKHLAICDSLSTIKSFITYKLSKAITKPTTSTTGSASFVCVGCGTTTTVLKLPVLNEQNYDVEVTPNFTRYTYVLSIHADPIVIEIAR